MATSTLGTYEAVSAASVMMLNMCIYSDSLYLKRHSALVLLTSSRDGLTAEEGQGHTYWWAQYAVGPAKQNPEEQSSSPLLSTHAPPRTPPQRAMAPLRLTIAGGPNVKRSESIKRISSVNCVRSIKLLRSHRIMTRPSRSVGGACLLVVLTMLHLVQQSQEDRSSQLSTH